MRRYIYAILVSFIFLSGTSLAEEKGADPYKLFYDGNSYYEKRDYAKAVESYIKVIDAGLESGNLYYNIGNGFFKLNKTGYAILCYEKARRFIPGDRDLKANLEYARSFVEESAPLGGARRRFILRLIGRPFRDLNLNSLAILASLLYILVVVWAALRMVAFRLAKRLATVHNIVIVIFVLTTVVFAMRYYGEEFVDHGIAVQNQAEARYEPIEKSIPYYKVYEGQKVAILETRSGWRKIRRADGKTGWVDQEAVEEISPP